MNLGGRRVDLGIYGRALVHLARHPSILAMPFLAAVIDMLVSYWGGLFTDPLGGFGGGLIAMILQIIYFFAFGVAIIQANNLERGRRGGFDDAWEESRPKTGGILIAAIGFQFVSFIALYINSLIGVGMISVGAFGQVSILQLIAYFFLILTVPAAAIGGLPGGLAISGSIRAVRANPIACTILAVVFVALWVFAPILAEIAAALRFGAVGAFLALAIARAIVLAYLAFPFATVYDDISFKLW